MSTVTVKVNGADKVAAKIRGYGYRTKELQPVWPEVHAYFRRAVNRQFATEGAYFGRPWRPLRPGYRLWKIRHGFSRKILVRTGEMKKSFRWQRISPNSAMYGSSNQKAVWHHHGTRRHGKRVNPPRPIIVITRKVRRDVRDIFADHIAGRVL